LVDEIRFLGLDGSAVKAGIKVNERTNTESVAGVVAGKKESIEPSKLSSCCLCTERECELQKAQRREQTDAKKAKGNRPGRGEEKEGDGAGCGREAGIREAGGSASPVHGVELDLAGAPPRAPGLSH
jgi:hypothetical protein